MPLSGFLQNGLTDQKRNKTRLQAFVGRLAAKYGPRERSENKAPRKGRTLLDISRDLQNDEIPFDVAMGRNFMPGERGGIPDFLRQPKTLPEQIMERLGQPGRPFEIPRGPDVSMSPVQSSPDFTGPAQLSPLQRQEAALSQMDQPLTRKQSLLQALTQAAPIAVGGLFGGTEGAYGASQGVEAGMAEQARSRDLRRRTLADQIEAARRREFETGEREAQQQFRTGERLGEQDYRTGERLGEEQFRSGESQRERELRQALQASEQDWRTGERTAEQGWRTGERIGEQDFRSGQRLAGQQFNAGQNEAEQAFRTRERLGTQDFQGRLQRDLANMRQPQGSGDVSALADMVQRDPSLLRQMNPALRGRVMSEIARSGGNLNSLNQQMVDKAIETADILEKHPGFSAAVGWRGPIGMFTGALRGTPAAGFESQFQTFKAESLIPALEAMRGLGAMSMNEFDAMRAAANALNTEMPEDEFWNSSESANR